MAGIHRRLTSQLCATLLVLLGRLVPAMADASADDFLPDRLQRVKLLGSSALRHGDDVTHIVPLSDGKRILTCAGDGTARLWDLGSGKEIRRYVHPKAERVWCALLIAGEREILLAGGNKAVTRWNLETGELLHTYAHQAMVFRLALTPDGKRFVSSDHKGHFTLWDISSGNEVRSFKGGTAGAYTVLVVDSGKTVIGAGDDGVVRFWDLESGERTNAVSNFGKDVFTLSASPDGRLMLVCSERPKIEIWETSSGRRKKRVTLPKQSRVGAWSPDGQRFAVSCGDNRLYVFDLAKGRLAYDVALPGDTHWSVSFSRNGEEIFCGSNHLVVRLEADTGRRIFPPEGATLQLDAVRILIPDVVRGVAYEHNAEDGVHVRDLETGEIRHTWLQEEDDIDALAISSCGRALLVADDKTVYLLNTASGKILQKFHHQRSVTDISFALADEAVVTVDYGGALYLWRSRDGRRLRKSREQNDHSSSAIALSPDERCLAIARSGKVQVWDMRSGRVVATLVPPLPAGEAKRSYYRIYGCSFDPRDGRSILMCGEKQLCYWKADTGDVTVIGDKEFASLIEALGAASFAKRETASECLVAGGLALLTRLEQVGSADPEVSERLKVVQVAIQERTCYAAEPRVMASDTDVHNARFIGRRGYWVASLSRGAESPLIVGEIRDGEPVIIREINDGEGVECLNISEDGRRIFVGNLNGTISVYAVAP